MNPYEQLIRFFASDPDNEEVEDYCKKLRVQPEYSELDHKVGEYGLNWIDTYELMARAVVNQNGE